MKSPQSALVGFCIGVLVGGGLVHGTGDLVLFSNKQTSAQLVTSAKQNNSRTEQAPSLKGAAPGLEQPVVEATPKVEPQPVTAINSTEKSDGSSEERSERSTGLFLEAQLERAQEVVTLSSAERDQIKAALEGGASFRAALSATLGKARTDEFFNLERSRQNEAERDDEEQLLFTLIRKLRLSPEQEAQVGSTLRSIRTDQAPLRNRVQALEEQAMDQHSQGAMSTLRNTFEEMKVINTELADQERVRLREELKGSLTDEQMNQLIELQERDRR